MFLKNFTGGKTTQASVLARINQSTSTELPMTNISRYTGNEELFTITCGFNATHNYTSSTSSYLFIDFQGFLIITE